jgi:hypothetical protein
MSDSVESLAKTNSKRVRFDLQEFRHARNNSPLSPERTEAASASIRGPGASSGNGTGTFVSHKWGYYEPVTDKPVPAALPEKRARVQRNTNSDYLGRAHAATVVDVEDVDDDDVDPDGVDTETLAEADQETAPESFEEAAQKELWVQSMKDEVNALKNRGVWRVVPTPGGVRLIKSKYVYRVKKDWTGRVVKRKSRLVVQGFLQREGIDYDETFAPVAKVTTFRLMLAMAKVLDLHIHQLDVDSAFLYADLDEDLYMKPPPGMSIKAGYCLKLMRSLYGLKQAPRNWNKQIVDHIVSMGFKQSVLDNCLFVKTDGDETYLISLYVDDILIAGSDLSKIEEIKSEFTSRYEMKDLGELNYYLGMKVTRTADYIQLDQQRYTLDILLKYDHLLKEFGN